MSNKHNQQWLEAANENFEQAIADKNWHLAQSVLSDINEAGFEEDADLLLVVLRKAQEGGMAKTGALTIDEHYGRKMVKISFGMPVPHVRFDAQDLDKLIPALQEARKQL